MINLSVKELHILLVAYREYTCKDCPYKGDNSICSCDQLGYKIRDEINRLNELQSNP